MKLKKGVLKGTASIALVAAVILALMHLTLAIAEGEQLVEAPTFTPSLLIKDSHNSLVQADITIATREGQVITTSRSGSGIAAVQTIKEGKYEIKMDLKKGPVSQITLHDVRLTKQTAGFIRVDDVAENIPSPIGKWEEVFAIDPSPLNFTNGTATAIAKGTQLYKCAEWDFDSQSCNGEWDFVQSIRPGTAYEIELSSENLAYGEIVVTKALHLDETYALISDVYEEVREQDDVWSEPIYAGEFVRVTFEKNLTNVNDITIYARNNESSNTSVSVYIAGTQEKIVDFPLILEELEYKVYLTAMQGAHDTFDLKVVSESPDAFLEFDLITDPVIISGDEAHDMDIAILNDTTGMFVMAWCDDSDDSARYQVFYSNRTTYRPLNEFDTSAGDSCRISVSSLNSTSFVITYADWTNGGSDWVIVGYTINDYALFSAVIVDTDTNANVDAGVCALNRTRYASVFMDDQDNDATYVMYDLGTQILGQTDVDTDANPGRRDDQFVECVAVSNNSWVFAWYDDSPDEVVFTMQNAEGTETVARTLVNATSLDASVTTAALQDGSFVVVYCDSDTSDVAFKVYNASGNATTDVITVDSSVQGCDNDDGTKIEVTALNTSDSRFTVVYDEEETDTVFMATYNKSGAVILAPQLLDTTDATDKTIGLAGYDPIRKQTACLYAYNPLIVAYNNQSGPNAIWETYFADGTKWSGACVLDTVAPNIALVSPANNTIRNTTGLQNFSFKPTDNIYGISSCNTVLNGVPNTSVTGGIVQNANRNLTSNLAQAKYTWTVNCTDSSSALNNNTNTTLRTLTVDVEAPNITIGAPVNGFVNITRNITFNFTAIDNLATSQSCDLIINGKVNATNASVKNNTHTYITVRNFNHGTYQYNISCFDNAKNLNFSSTRNFTINITPTLVNVSAAPDPILGGAVITLNSTDADDPNNDTLNFYCDTSTTPTAANTDCTGGVTTDTTKPYNLTCTFATATTTQTNTVYCRMFDGRFYSSAVSVAYTTDSTPPTTTIASVAGDPDATYYDTIDDSITIINISGEAGMLCRIGTSDVAYSSLSDDCPVTGTQANCSQVTTVQGNNAYNFFVSCRDSLGNEQNSTQNNDITSFVTDWAAPATYDNSTANISRPDYAVAIFEVDAVDSDPTTAYCTDTIGACVPGTSIDNASAVTFTSANRGVNYLRYNSSDNAGNIQAITNITININRLANFTNASDNVSIVKGTGNITITTNSTDDDIQNLSLYVCKTASANHTGCDTAANTYCSNRTATNFSSCSLIAETADGDYNWFAFIYDSVNESAFLNHSGSYTSDSTPPVITVINPTNTTHTQNSLAASISLDEAGLWAGYSLDGAANVSMNRVTDQIWTVTLDGLSNGGHQIEFYANDSVNNSGSASRIFSVDASGSDTTPPTITIITPQNNSRFNKTATSILLNISMAENTTWAGYSLDGAANITMGNITNRIWNATLSGQSDGNHSIVFYANDSSDNAGASNNITFSTDANAPVYSDFNITPLTVNDTINITIYSNWTDGIGLSHAQVQENSSGTAVNHTVAMSGDFSWANYTINASGISPGDISIVIYANDTSGNFNQTAALLVSVADVTPPQFNITYSPTDVDELDPNVIINVSANVSDYSNSSFAILQFKETTAAEWSNFSMTREGNHKWIGNFTPTTTANWSFRVHANDTHANANTSINTTLEITLEPSWIVLSFGANSSSALLSTNKTIGSFRINNTGDFDLEFDLSYTPATIDVFFNQTDPFNVSSGSVQEILVNVTALGTQSTTEIAIKVDATNATAQPDFSYANITFVSTADGPFMFVTIQKPEVGASVQTGTNGFNLSATVKNLGTQDATGAWLKWTLPTGFTNNSALNRSIGFLGVGESATNILTADIASTLDAGTYTLSVNASNLENANGSATRTVTITEPATISSSTATATGGSAAGGGGGGSAGGGGGSNILSTVRDVESVQVNQTYELVRGQGNTFPLTVRNVYKEATMYNVTVQLSGFLSQYLNISPAVISRIEPGNADSFQITITSPRYQAEGRYELEFEITGRIIGVRVTDLGNGNFATQYKISELVEKRLVTLIIHDISQDEAALKLSQARLDVDIVAAAGIPFAKLSKLLGEMEDAYARKQYKTVKDLRNTIADMKSDALDAHALITEVQSGIGQAADRGLSVVETRKLLNLALAAFEREDFATALRRAKEAQLSSIIETQGKVNILNFLQRYWWAVSAGLLSATIAGYFARKRIVLALIARHLEDLAKEATTIQQLMEETQTQTFTDKKMSTTEYHKVMYKFETRLTEIRELQMKLRNQKVGIVRVAEEISSLKKQKAALDEEVKALQNSYYNQGAISKAKYARRMETNKLRDIEIEKAITMLETRQARKEVQKELKEGKKKEQFRMPIKKKIVIEPVHRPHHPKRDARKAMLSDLTSIFAQSGEEIATPHTPDEIALKKHGFKVKPKQKIVPHEKKDILRKLKEVHRL